MTLPDRIPTSDAPPPSRGPEVGRRVVFAGAGVAAIGAVAACGGGTTTTDDDGGQQEAGDAPQGAPGTTLGPSSEVPVGSGKIYSDEQVVVTQPQPGQFTGLSAICPHQGCAVSTVTDGQIVCPCHDSRFGLDGSVQKGPAQQPLQQRPVTVADGSVTLA
ncbi:MULTISPECIES: Rieske (2Fe-2S) protein [unclassified Pseudonocardia]|uniref:Rieske (2Fe-2S) protein n=1 Tax=unclassified Pseudonocardia TaxID=2619320 RepID=UPI0001FFF310|nr:Rieske (2Fe-2S) protein [Pseudonocardia sp. Ae707_Ps1]OLM17187.1 putative iron sulfur protein (putative secreted protein) [Pseudonocardia sp. Ae707_Ps1]